MKILSFTVEHLSDFQFGTDFALAGRGWRGVVVQARLAGQPARFSELTADFALSPIRAAEAAVLI